MNKIMKFIKKNGFNVLISLLIIMIVIFSLFFKTIRVNGPSMEPNYVSDDIVIIEKNPKNISVGDVITINGSKMTEATGETVSNMIKRVVAGPGDKVLIENDNIYINDILKKDSYNGEIIYGTSHVEYYLDEDEYFILGDNRNNSRDSRDYGPIKKDWIDGLAVYKLYNKK